MRVLVAMSGGVDSSVAAASLAAAGHDVVGCTLKLWGGPSDSGCCSVADVDDARRVAQQLGIAHHVFNFEEDFHRDVVAPYVAEHAAGRTPNPCIECNRHVKFDRLLERARRLGFDKLATGHHAQVAPDAATGRLVLRRGADRAKDQSYVLSMLGQRELADVVFPVGRLQKADVRAEARRLGLRTAAKPDSQDVCFIHGETGRAAFLADRLALHPGVVVDDESGAVLGTVEAVELVTVGQRRGMPPGGVGRAPGEARRYAVAVDVPARTVRVSHAARATVSEVVLRPGSVTWSDAPATDGARAFAQASAHGRAARCSVHLGAAGTGVRVCFDEPQRPVAPGQTLALYDAADPDAVLGAGIVGHSPLAGSAP